MKNSIVYLNNICIFGEQLKQIGIMKNLNVTTVTSKNYNSKSVTNYFENGISKEEIKEFLNGNRDIKFLEVEEKNIKLIGSSNVIVRFESELEFLSNI